jgi:hypothetical protein
MLRQSEDLATGEINATRFFGRIKDLKGGFGAIFGKDGGEIIQLAKTLAARGGKISPEELVDGNVKQAFLKAIAKQKERETFMNNNFISSLQKGGRDFEDAVDFLFASNRQRQVAEAKTFFGENSEAWRQIQRTSMKKLLRNLVTTGDDPVKTVLNGQKLAEEVGKFKGVIVEMHGKTIFHDLKEFADTAFLLTSKKKLSGGLVAANIALHPVKNLGKLAQLNFLSRMLATDGAIRLFTVGWKAPAFRKGSDESFRTMSQVFSQNINDLIQSIGPQELGIDTEVDTPQAVGQ